MEDRIIKLENCVKNMLVDYANNSGLDWKFSSYSVKNNKDDSSSYIIFIRKKSPKVSPRRLSITITDGTDDVIIRRNINGILLEDTIDINDSIKLLEIGINWILGLLSESNDTLT